MCVHSLSNGILSIAALSISSSLKAFLLNNIKHTPDAHLIVFHYPPLSSMAISFSSLCLGIFVSLFCWRLFSLCRWDYLHTHGHQPASALQVLRLKEYSTRPSWFNSYISKDKNINQFHISGSTRQFCVLSNEFSSGKSWGSTRRI